MCDLLSDIKGRDPVSVIIVFLKFSKFKKKLTDDSDSTWTLWYWKLWMVHEIDKRNSNWAFQIQITKRKHSLVLRPQASKWVSQILKKKLNILIRSDQLVCLTHSPMRCMLKLNGENKKKLMNLTCIRFKFTENLSRFVFNSMDIRSLAYPIPIIRRE